VTYTLRTFGGLGLTGTTGPLPFAERHRKPMALLAMLAGAGERGLSREKLAAYLWLESDTERARGGLKQTLYILRKELSAEELFLGSAELRLNPAVIQSDLGEFERLAAAGEAERAVGLYAGHFLDGVHLSDASEFDRWADEQRERLARRMSTLLERLALMASGRHDPRAAAEWWIRLIEHDPFDTHAVTGLLHAFLEAGDRPRALKYAERHMALLRKELDLTPDPELRKLVEQVRARPVPPPS
jgi:DNA-binding SARP family transcriptional activator